LSGDRLKRFPILASFTAEDRTALAELLEERKVPKGRRLFTEGSESEGLVLICSGVVKLKSKTAGDLGYVGEGHALGGLSLVTIGPREVTAIVEEPVELFMLERSAYHRLSEDFPRAACRLAEGIAAELGATLRQGLDRIIEAGQG
jgi:CRP-like cAMP-binding protein